MQRMSEDDSDEVGLGAVPRLHIVVKASMKVLLVPRGEEHLGGRAGGDEEDRDYMSWKKMVYSN